MTAEDLAITTKSLWAKTSFCEEGLLWLPLYQHLDDAAEIASFLYDHWLSPNAKRVLEAAFNNKEQTKAFVVFLAGIHDIGKATPGFAQKNSQLAQRVKEAGLTHTLLPCDSRALHHAIAGQLVLERYLVAKQFNLDDASRIASVVGAHHGTSLNEYEMSTKRRNKENTSTSLGDSEWEKAQDQLIDYIYKKTSLELESTNMNRLSQPVLVLIEGVVVLADWIASNTSLFRLFPLNQDFSYETERAKRAWQKLDLPPYSKFSLPGIDADELFRARFNLGKENQARPVQAEAIQAALVSDLDSLMVIEAPPGEGKTEAALLAAEILAARAGSSGFHIAMPTQATTDAMFRRVVNWLRQIPERESSVALIHGNAPLNILYKTIQGDVVVNPKAEFVDEDEDDLTNKVYTHRWMLEKRKSPLSEVVVGTIDQLLFTALQARHLALRHLGIANKVVIVDECHAYDAYMRVYLEMALEWLGAYGVPVVLLSATLPESIKQRLIHAYEKVHRKPVTKKKRRLAALRNSEPEQCAAMIEEAEVAQPQTVALSNKPYPLITTALHGKKNERAVKPSGRALDINISLLNDDMGQLEALLEKSLEGGGCALVLRNTVKRAQTCFDRLTERFGAEAVSLMHSRFLSCDRVANDAWLVERFGSNTPDGSRPKKHIVVATQVVEQSLDVDFDLLITDIAPMDLLLQRMGRLHRHTRSRPSLLREPHCYVTAVEDWSKNPIDIVPGCTRVYGMQSLYRSGSLLREVVTQSGTISFPHEIPLLVEKAYSKEFSAPDSWESVMEEASRREEETLSDMKARASSYCLASPKKDQGLNSWIPFSVGNVDEDHEGRAQVRDISEDSLEVLALCKIDGFWSLPPWVDPQGEWEGYVFENANLDRDLAEKIRSCMIRLPVYFPCGVTTDDLISSLEEDYIYEWQGHHLLSGQLILPFTTLHNQTLDEHQVFEYQMNANLLGLEFNYSRQRGLTIKESESNE